MAKYMVFGADAETGADVEPFVVEAGSETEAASNARERGVYVSSCERLSESHAQSPRVSSRRATVVNARSYLALDIFRFLLLGGGALQLAVGVFLFFAYDMFQDAGLILGVWCLAGALGAFAAASFLGLCIHIAKDLERIRKHVENWRTEMQ